MNGNFFMGMALGALAGVVIAENKKQAKQLLQKCTDAVGTMSSQQSGQSSDSSQN